MKPDSVARRLSYRQGDRHRNKREAVRRKPAYWSWEVTIDALEAAHRARTQVQAYYVLMEWQRGRCAVCGTSGSELQLDHDHATGLIRGLLCGSCNCRERGLGSKAIGLYRHMPPAFFLDMQIKKAVGGSLVRNVSPSRTQREEEKP